MAVVIDEDDRVWCGKAVCTFWGDKEARCGNCPLEKIFKAWIKDYSENIVDTIVNQFLLNP